MIQIGTKHAIQRFLMLEDWSLWPSSKLWGRLSVIVDNPKGRRKL
jgi:hypothetical protein